MIALLLIGAAHPIAAQTGAALLDVRVDAGYDGVYRADMWFPVLVTVENNGDSFRGAVQVRAATSRGVNGNYRLSLDFPSGSRQRDHLYVSADGTLTSLVVELVDEDGALLAEQAVPMRALQPTDQLVAVLTQSAAGSIDLSGAHGLGMGGAQVNWELENLPDRVGALSAINMMVFTDIDSSGMTLVQEETLAAWVAGGGHLVVTGGPNATLTASGVQGLLPVTPQDSVTVEGLTPLADFIADANRLREPTVIAVGPLREGADVLVETLDGYPLLVRQRMGDGVADYLAADPNIEPLRGWGAQWAFWYVVAYTAPPRPAWSYGTTRWNDATTASEILPGVDVLPNALPLLGFLVAYVLLMGPINYLVLRAIGRRGLAWVTIPVLIAVFSTIAYIAGRELRGTQASLAHVTLVRSWPNTDIAHTTELLGLLSPQRTRYTLNAPDGSLLRPIPRNTLSATNTALGATFDASITLEQAEGFRADDFSVDASFIAGFESVGTVTRPDISGSAAMRIVSNTGGNPMGTSYEIRGSVRNDSEQTLTDGLIFARGMAHHLGEPLAPGDVATFAFSPQRNEPPAPAPIGYERTRANLGYGYSNDATAAVAMQVMGEFYNPYSYNHGYSYLNDGEELTDTQQQDYYRRQQFITAIAPTLHTSSGIGDRIYFIGWTTEAPTTPTLAGETYTPYASTVHVVELETAYVYPVDNAAVWIDRDMFTWTVDARNGIGVASVVNLSVPEGNNLGLRYTPYPSAQLETVERLLIYANRNVGGNSLVPLSIWDWQRNRWVSESVVNGVLAINEPTAYIGPQNTVKLLITGADNSARTLEYVYVEQVGRYGY